MIKEIIYGKRQSGKNTHVIKRMLQDDGKSAYLCYNENHANKLKQEYPELKYRITTSKIFVKAFP